MITFIVSWVVSYYALKYLKAYIPFKVAVLIFAIVAISAVVMTYIVRKRMWMMERPENKDLRAQNVGIYIRHKHVAIALWMLATELLIHFASWSALIVKIFHLVRGH